MNPNKPRDYDVVLGRQASASVSSAVLGGVEGFKQRLANPSLALREAALQEALQYGQVGLDTVIQALSDESVQIQQSAYALLQKLALPKAKQALREYCNRRVQELQRRYAAGERNFKQIALRGANLSGANLSWANLRGANLREADLSWANLRGTDLSWADLRKANLRGTSLNGANLREANLMKTDLREADLKEAHLMSANLMRTDLREAKNLSQANLSGANLSEVNLSWANLSGAYLNWVNLNGANLCGANLCGAYLIRADLSGADLSGSIYNLKTIFPRGFNPNHVGAAYR